MNSNKVTKLVTRRVTYKYIYIKMIKSILGAVGLLDIYYYYYYYNFSDNTVLSYVRSWVRLLMHSSVYLLMWVVEWVTDPVVVGAVVVGAYMGAFVGVLVSVPDDEGRRCRNTNRSTNVFFYDRFLPPLFHCQNNDHQYRRHDHHCSIPSQESRRTTPLIRRRDHNERF